MNRFGSWLGGSVMCWLVDEGGVGWFTWLVVSKGGEGRGEGRGSWKGRGGTLRTPSLLLWSTNKRS